MVTIYITFIPDQDEFGELHRKTREAVDKIAQEHGVNAIKVR